MPIGIAVRYDNPFCTIGEFDGLCEIREVIGDVIDCVPYPTQLNKPKLFVFVADSGLLLGLPYNRWGLVGNFCIVKLSRDRRFLTITDAEAEAVVYDIRDSKGYLDKTCLVQTPLREPFDKFGEPPLGYQPLGDKWFT
ncbi:MAG: hypothetical protein ACKVP0_17030 [Pirellulaceae bacterium]